MSKSPSSHAPAITPSPLCHRTPSGECHSKMPISPYLMLWIGGRAPRGRPPKTWIEYVREDLVRSAWGVWNIHELVG
jgi:hypothetical protein